MRILRDKENAQYSELMKHCGLDPLTQTGVFNYHIGHMIGIDVIRKEKDGSYSLTSLGRKIADLLLAIENAYPKAFHREVKGGEKMEKVGIQADEEKRKAVGDEFVRLTMHHSGLYYMQTDLDPENVKSIVFLASKDGKVADIVPLFKTRICPDACTSIEDVRKLMKEDEEYVNAFIPSQLSYSTNVSH